MRGQIAKLSRLKPPLNGVKGERGGAEIGKKWRIYPEDGNERWKKMVLEMIKRDKWIYNIFVRGILRYLLILSFFERGYK